MVDSAFPSAGWHATDVEDVFRYLDSSPQGLSSQEAAERLARHGPNRLPEARTRGPLIRFLSQFHNVLIYVLLAAAGVTSLLGQWVDAGVILGVVVINAFIGFMQEGKAEDALKAIRRMLTPHAMVLRDSRQMAVFAEALVPGDVVLLQSGDKVPADLRLFRVKGLQIQEAALTGESIAVEKATAPVPAHAVLGDRLCMAYSGTLVTHGQGAGVVVATGAQTELGHISSLVSETETATTPLLRQMAQFGRWLTAGIRVKMITGDHAGTARAIARQLGLANSDDVLSGEMLDAMSDDALRQEVRKVDVYARVSPEHKLRLVRLLQEHGLIVAMTGDGVNDAPALKRADVGIAMGCKGTEAAKEAAEIVLADDNFASIAHAVEEGRTVYDNLKKSILFILPTNMGEALIVLAAIVLGFHQLPLTPVQILWVNMITTVTLALSLGFEPPEKNVMQRPPRNAAEPLLDRLLIWRLAFVSLILMGGTFALFAHFLETTGDIRHARTIAVNTLVMFEIFYLLNSRYITEPALTREGLTGNHFVLLAIAMLVLFQLAFTYLAPMRALFGTTAISLHQWLWITLIASSVFLLVELEKYLLRTRTPARHH